MPGGARDTPLAITFRALTAPEPPVQAPRNCQKGKGMIMTGTGVTQRLTGMVVQLMIVAVDMQVLDMRDTIRMMPGIQDTKGATIQDRIQDTGIIGMAGI